jgi:tetratricopeptide (TPR) repeat protein
MRITVFAGILSAALVHCALAQSGPGSVEAQMRAATKKVQSAMSHAEGLVDDGRVSEANRIVLDVFPEASRTPAQSLVLANVLFKQQPKVSYELHKSAAAALPEMANAQLEWAMEQHRAREYAGAAATYRAFLKLEPETAPAWGMLAECLIRTDDVQGALDAWKKSEQAQSGSLEQFETFVCEVNGKPDSDAERERLLGLVAAGDCPAASRLLLMDADWERDWWNRGPKVMYLGHDLAAVKESKCAAERQVKEAVTAAECAVSDAGDDGEALAGGTPKERLTKAGYLFDDHQTLPENGKALSLMLARAIATGALSDESAREKYGDAVLALAKRTNDRDAFNVAAHLYLGTPRLKEVDRDGWEATHDAKFGASFLWGLFRDKQLTPESKDLAEAVKAFPDDADIAQVALLVGTAAGKPLEPLLVSAIKAEYRHFSTREALAAFARPRAQTLRSYFKALDRVKSGDEKTARKWLTGA